MDFRNYQKILGKNFLEISNQLERDFDLNYENTYLSLKSISQPQEFYGKQARDVVILNDNGVVGSIKFYFDHIIDKSFYMEMVRHYDLPDSIQVVEKKEVLEKGKDMDTLIPKYSEKSFLTMREGTFEEKPLFIFWNKKDFQIEILFKRELHTSEITFRRLTKEFNHP